ncbi:hypothetical protein V6N13_144185 [Hibiscus sabdariffa]|uniref:Epidermal patterning factor-like protein n=1 Tax=Hibiscus sabdariffa TaxID=183260 RepID=A0ABR2FJN0_9ROSI
MPRLSAKRSLKSAVREWCTQDFLISSLCFLGSVSQLSPQSLILHIITLLMLTGKPESLVCEAISAPIHANAQDKEELGFKPFGFSNFGKWDFVFSKLFPPQYIPTNTLEISLIISQSTSSPFEGFEDMEGRLLCFLLALQIVRWTCATSRPLAPNDGLGSRPPGQKPEALQVSLSSKETSSQSLKSMERAGGESKVGIGSSPPNCEHKCYGCTPCEAIQVPTTTSKRVHVGLQYANYEPESWKCKCGPSFYSP